jgi:DNA-directed RNA polymerase specialized sigma subunit
MESQIEQQLEKIMPEDLARTFESAYHVLFQGQHEHMDDLLKHGAVLLRKAAQRFTPTQMVLGVAGLATVAIILIGREMHKEQQEGEAHDVSPRNEKRQLAGANGGNQNKGNGNGNK